MKKWYLSLLFVLLFVATAFAKVNVNTATADELAAIKGIGKVKAEAIVAYRTEHGKFSSIDELVKVKGIGEKILQKIKPEVNLGE